MKDRPAPGSSSIVSTAILLDPAGVPWIVGIDRGLGDAVHGDVEFLYDSLSLALELDPVEVAPGTVVAQSGGIWCVIRAESVRRGQWTGWDWIPTCKIDDQRIVVVGAIDDGLRQVGEGNRLGRIAVDRELYVVSNPLRFELIGLPVVDSVAAGAGGVDDQDSIRACGGRGLREAYSRHQAG